MKKAELIEAVAKETGLSKNDVDSVIKSTMSNIMNAIARGEKVSFIGFGNFEPTTRAARETKIPNTDKVVQVPASKSVKFKVGKNFKELVNNK